MAKEPTYPHVEAALRYARDVVAGRILACQWVILACKRQLDDLGRWDGVDGAPYFFDRAAAERVIKFEEMMPHVKGEWARKRMTLKLEPWQKFILSTLFGWKRAKDGLRRFREAYMEIPRKNGKSCFVAPVGLYMFVEDGEAGAEVYRRHYGKTGVGSVRPRADHGQARRRLHGALRRGRPRQEYEPHRFRVQIRTVDRGPRRRRVAALRHR